MPAICWSNFSRQMALWQMRAYGPGLIIHLYDNNVTPAPTNVLADFNEASYPGYASIPWDPGLPSIVAPNRAAWAPFSALFPPPLSGGAVSIYGFYITFQTTYGAGHWLMQAARFTGAPISFSPATDPIFFVVQDSDYDINNP